jgi:hypothetical protein
MLKPGGFACIHLLSYGHFREHMTPALFRAEVDQQIAGREGHWHHYYGVEEMEAVLAYGMAARDPRVREHAGSLYFCFSR